MKSRSLLVLALPLILNACHGDLAPPGVLRVQLGGEPVSLDPSLAEDGGSLRILGNVMEGLVGFDGAGKLQNRLAESYRVSPEGLRYEFTLRPGLKWSDGKPVEVSEFVLALRRALSPATASKLATLYYPIRNAREVHDGHLAPEKLGVRAEAGKLVIELESPSSYFVQALALAQAVPLRQDVLDQNHGHWPDTPPSTGPYFIQAHVPDQRIILKRNPHYWAWEGKSSPALPEVDLVVVEDESTGSSLFEQRRIDILTKIPSLEYAKYRDSGRLHVDPFFATYYIAFNVAKDPFRTPQLRGVIAHAINKAEIVAAVGTGEVPADSFIPRGIEGYFPPEPPAAITKTSVDVLRGITLAFDTGSRNTMIAEKIQSDVKERAGIAITLQNLDWKAYIKSLQADAPQLYRFGWLAPINDPIMHLKVFTSGDANNYSHFSNPRYDGLVKQIEILPSGAERTEKIRQAQKILLAEETVVIPIYHYVQNHAVTERVRNFRVNPFGVIRFDELRLDE